YVQRRCALRNCGVSGGTEELVFVLCQYSHRRQLSIDLCATCHEREDAPQWRRDPLPLRIRGVLRDAEQSRYEGITQYATRSIQKHRLAEVTTSQKKKTSAAQPPAALWGDTLSHRKAHPHPPV